MPERQRPVHQAGPVRDVVFAIRSKGDSPAREYYESLSDGDKSKFDTLFLWMAEHGVIRNPEKFRPNVGQGVCKIGKDFRTITFGEFKIHSGPGRRIMAFLNGRQWVLTHGFDKGSRVAVELDRAKGIACEDLTRLANPRPAEGR